MSRPVVLLWSTEASYATAIRIAARAGGLETRCLTRVASTPLPRIASLLVANLRGFGVSPMQAAQKLRARLPETPLVALLYDPEPEETRNLLRLGAAEVIPLPRPPGSVARRALAHVLGPQGDAVDESLPGGSPEMCHLKRQIRSVAPHAATVLLQGATGTGKGRIARIIHEQSPRASKPFVHVDCGALAETVIESELFGHERGAFTGAVRRRRGHFEEAADGTVFLDEVGEFAPHLQAKLLRVLEERTFHRVGGTKPIRMTARVIAATRRDLEHQVCTRRFREDLYYRLRVFVLRVPPLRDRLDDLPALVRHGLSELAGRYGLEPPTTTVSFYRVLESHPWPGNVRELLHVLEHVLLSSQQGVLDEVSVHGLLHGLGPARGDLRPGLPDAEWLAGDDPNRVRDALITAHGNVSEAARLLSLPRTTLRNRIQRFGLAVYVDDGRRRPKPGLARPRSTASAVKTSNGGTNTSATAGYSDPGVALISAREYPDRAN